MKPMLSVSVRHTSCTNIPVKRLQTHIAKLKLHHKLLDHLNFVSVLVLRLSLRLCLCLFSLGVLTFRGGLRLGSEVYTTATDSVRRI